MKGLLAATLTSLSIVGYISPVRAQVVHMESLYGHAWGACQYMNHQLICNTDAVQTFANGRKLSGLFMYNCETGKMTIKNPDFIDANGNLEQTIEGVVEEWVIDTDAERKFVQEKCHNFEVATGGEDGLLADGDYKFEYTADGRLTCRNTRQNKLHPLQRCKDALKSRF
jgi:hypothetical protein